MLRQKSSHNNISVGLRYDYLLFDNRHIAESDEKAEYYQNSFSEELQTAIATNPDAPFTEAYYTAMYAETQIIRIAMAF